MSRLISKLKLSFSAGLASSVALFAFATMPASAEGIFIRADVVGGSIEDQISSTTTTYDFEADGVGFGIRGGYTRPISFAPALEWGTEFRLAYLPLEDTDGNGTFKTGIQFGTFSRLQMAESFGPVQPYVALGMSGTSKEVTSTTALNEYTEFQMKLAGALGVDFQFPDSGFVVGLDASKSLEGPTALRGSVGFNF